MHTGKLAVLESLCRSTCGNMQPSQHLMSYITCRTSRLHQAVLRGTSAAGSSSISYHVREVSCNIPGSSDGTTSSSSSSNYGGSSNNCSSSSSNSGLLPTSLSTNPDRASASLHKHTIPHIFSMSGLSNARPQPLHNILSNHTTTLRWMAQAQFFCTRSRHPTPNHFLHASVESPKPTRRRGVSQVQEAKGEDIHPPGSARWNEWLQQLQLAGLTSTQAFTSLSSTPSLLKQSPDNKAGDFKKLSAILMGESDLTKDQLKQIVMVYPQIMRITHKGGLLGNINWFKQALELDTQEWVGLILGCRPLISLREEGLQQRFEALIGMGLDSHDIKACWVRIPELLKLSAESMIEKVETLQALFPQMSVKEVLRTHPAVLLQGSGNLRDRVLFLQKLGRPERVITLADVMVGSPDVEFSLQAVGAHQAASGKSLQQLCRELQLQTGVGAYMQAGNLNPDTITAYKYFLVVVMFGKASRDPMGAPLVAKT